MALYQLIEVQNKLKSINWYLKAIELLFGWICPVKSVNSNYKKILYSSSFPNDCFRSVSHYNTVNNLKQSVEYLFTYLCSNVIYTVGKVIWKGGEITGKGRKVISVLSEIERGKVTCSSLLYDCQFLHANLLIGHV